MADAADLKSAGRDVVGSSPFLPCQFTWQGGVGELLGELRFPEYRGVAQLVERR